MADRTQQTQLMSSPSFLAKTDPPAVELCHSEGQAPVLLTCDHASRQVPQSLKNLGLASEALARHIGWDIGAADVTRRLAPLLDAPAILAGYSRLVIDCNRRPDDPSSIPRESDDVEIPGNANLSDAQRRTRREALFDPYHGAIAAWIAARRAKGVAPAVISLHSFTPVMKGAERPWHIGVLWDGQGRIAIPLLDALQIEPDLIVGDNQPYSAREPVGYTQRHHAFEPGLPHVAIELRQDLIADDQGAAEWAERLARLLNPILAMTGLYVAIDRSGPHT